jgi:hypothetical protein
LSEKKLTPGQEQFAQLVAAGKSQSEAYRQSYPKSQAWKDDAVWSQASRLMPKVSARVEQLRAELATKTLWTMEQATTLLVDVATNLDERAGDRIKAIAELNKLHGFGVAKAADETVIVRWYGL